VSDDFEKRFWPRVQKSDGCWLWTGGANSNGYGRFQLNGSQTQATRALWTVTYGPIPDGMVVCHHCDNPPCVRLDHLFLGTRGDNMRDCGSKGRHNSQKTPGFGFADPAFQKQHGRGGHVRTYAKLTELQVAEIRSLKAGGARPVDLCRQFGMSKSTIWKITTGKTWRTK
jgi:hypothetical protein